jgi:hypothetical protein
MSFENPELQIAWAPQFSMGFRLSKVEHAVSVGCTSWLFAFQCVVRHPTGRFNYEANDLYFDLEYFERFRDQLGAMRNGHAQRATLSDQGEMLVFSLYLDEQRLKSSIRVREYQAGDDLTTLNAGFVVDYDLFVNKLYSVLNEFINSVRLVAPQQV